MRSIKEKLIGQTQTSCLKSQNLKINLIYNFFFLKGIALILKSL